MRSAGGHRQQAFRLSSYSLRRACIGSTDAARAAGTNAATELVIAITQHAPATPRSVPESNMPLFAVDQNRVASSLQWYHMVMCVAHMMLEGRRGSR